MPFVEFMCEFLIKEGKRMFMIRHWLKSFLSVLIVLESKKCYTKNINERDNVSIMGAGGVVNDSFTANRNKGIRKIARR